MRKIFMAFVAAILLLLLAIIYVTSNAASPQLLSFEREPNGSLRWTFSESVKGHVVEYRASRCDSLLAEAPLATLTVYLDGPGTHASSWPAGSIPPGQWIVSRPLIDGAEAGCAASWLGPGPQPDRSPCVPTPPGPPRRLPQTAMTSAWPGPDGAVQLPEVPSPAHALELVQVASGMIARGQGWKLWHPVTSIEACPRVVDSLVVQEWAYPDSMFGRWRFIWVFDGPPLGDPTWSPFVPAVP